MVRERFHQASNGLGKWAEVKATQMNHLARDVEAEEVIGGQKTTVKATIIMPKKLFDEFGNLCVGEE